MLKCVFLFLQAREHSGTWKKSPRTALLCAQRKTTSRRNVYRVREESWLQPSLMTSHCLPSNAKLNADRRATTDRVLLISTPWRCVFFLRSLIIQAVEHVAKCIKYISYTQLQETFQNDQHCRKACTFSVILFYFVIFVVRKYACMKCIMCWLGELSSLAWCLTITTKQRSQLALSSRILVPDCWTLHFPLCIVAWTSIYKINQKVLSAF